MGFNSGFKGLNGGVFSPSYHGRSTSSDKANSTQRIERSVGSRPGLETGENTNICPVPIIVVRSL